MTHDGPSRLDPQRVSLLVIAILMLAIASFVQRRGDARSACVFNALTGSARALSRWW
ncbi:hypothetical protein KIF59_18095 [Enterobacter cloacae subsp. cloacae]|nr:hypothetical protein [Enterobacter cloacae subsp. cloacae]